MAVAFPYTNEEVEMMEKLYAQIVNDIKTLRHMIYQHNQSPVSCDKLSKMLTNMESIKSFIDNIIPVK